MVTAGFEATVAPLGTALTGDQLALLWKMADEPFFVLMGTGPAGVLLSGRRRLLCRWSSPVRAASLPMLPVTRIPMTWCAARPGRG